MPDIHDDWWRRGRNPKEDESDDWETDKEDSGATCPYCGEELFDDDIVQCPYCENIFRRKTIIKRLIQNGCFGLR